MAIKDVWNALIAKTNAENDENKLERPGFSVYSDAFPVVHVQEDRLSAYKQIPLATLASVGTAFSQLPESARTIVQTVTKTVASDKTLFVGINPKGIPGYLLENEFGTVGNIIQMNEQGKRIIAGRMRFKPIDALPVKETTTTVMPIDPTLMLVAFALMTIEKKLDGIQKSVGEVLQFLKHEKQAEQRGNLNMLADIMEGYKINCLNDTFCSSRSSEVVRIMSNALKNIDFYEKQIASELKKRKTLHGAKESQDLAESLCYQFAEYQLACHIYAFSSFLDILLQRNFEQEVIESTTKKMTDHIQRYEGLYDECHAQIAEYHRNSIESKIVGGVGAAAKGLGKAIAAVPIVRDGAVDETLISAGETIGKYRRDDVRKKLQVFEAFEESRMQTFVDGLHTVDVLYNTENAMFTDGTNLFLLQSV